MIGAALSYLLAYWAGFEQLLSVKCAGLGGIIGFLIGSFIAYMVITENFRMMSNADLVACVRDRVQFAFLAEKELSQRGIEIEQLFDDEESDDDFTGH